MKRRQAAQLLTLAAPALLQHSPFGRFECSWQAQAALAASGMRQPARRRRASSAGLVAASHDPGMLHAVIGFDRVRLRLDRVRAAVGEIDPAFLDTPALPCAPLGRVLGCSVTLKLETLNPVRSFKGRGTETVAAVARKKGASRVVCASAGNLGQALAYSGQHWGLDVTVVAARTANPLKLRQITAFGADVRLEGEDIEDARLLALEIAEAGRAYLVEDSLDLATCEVPPQSASSSFETIRSSTSCPSPSAAERWPAVWPM